MPRGQSLVLERGTISLGSSKVRDASVDTALGYTSVVGTMLAEELANAEDQVGNLDHTFSSCSPVFIKVMLVNWATFLFVSAHPLSFYLLC